MADTPGESTALEDLKTSAPPGMVIPSKSLCLFIERAASYVVRNGAAFVDALRRGGHNFIEAEDLNNPFYEWRIEEIKAGRALDITGVAAAKTDVTFAGRAPKAAPERPPEFTFSARMPTISALDLDVVKATALWAAKNGKSWVTALSQRRAGDPAFDFLRPQHSLNMYFNRLTEQYKDLIEGDMVDGGAPQAKRIAELQKNVQDRFHILERAKKRAEYGKWQEAQKVEKEEKEEKERVAFAQIDWQDFVVVETIVFDEADETTPLRPPMTKNDIQSQSLEQKAAMRIGSDRRLEEAVPDFDYDRMQEVPVQPGPAQVFAPEPTFAQPTPPPMQVFQPPEQEGDVSRVLSLQAERERVRAAQEAARGTQQPTRIRNDYVPQAQRRKLAQNTSICPNCRQAIPNDEMENHMRIEMLDPRWREQTRVNQQRSSTTNLSTVDVANNLKRLASQRSDVFDPVTGTSLPEDDFSQRKRLETEALAAANGLPPGTIGQQPPLGYPPATNVQDQIRSLHERFGK